MARIYPELVEDFHSSYGEFQIFEALKKLPSDWYIYHSLNWQKRSKTGKITWGEADFVIFNQQYGILVIEVKSGGISFSNGKWFQQRLDNKKINEMKNPFNQANRSKYKLIDEIDYKLQYGENCFIDKAVWFPSINLCDLNLANLPLEYNKRLILTKESLETPLNSIISVYNYYNSIKFTHLSTESKNIILNTLMPEFNLVPSASNIKNEADYIFYQLTNEQKKVLDFIDEQQTVAIQGAAGTGKTFIAIEQAKRLSKTNKILFLCFNKYLYLHLSQKCNFENVDYYNLHTFLSKFSSSDISTDEKCLTALKNINLIDMEYIAIIVDEAQDINAKILDYLYDISITNNIKYYMFYDKYQMLYQKKLPKCLDYFDCKLTLNKNCRNSLKILHTLNSIFNTKIDANGFCVNGIMPTLFFNKNTILLINELINKYITEGFNIGDITILTLTTESESRLNNVEYIGKYKISRDRNDENIFFTSSKKFKGLEANIIIVVDFDSRKYEEYEYQKNLYVSISRARQRLAIICNNVNGLEILANEINGGLDSTIKVARKFKVKIEE